MSLLSVYASIILTIIGVFIADLTLQLRIAVWLLYIPPLLFSLWKLKQATTYFLTGTCTALILLGYFNLSATSRDLEFLLLNRSLAICMLWLVVFFGMRYKRALEKIAALASDLTTQASELELANKELEAFNYTVSHDLRRPLSSIIGYCQLLEEQCAESSVVSCKEGLRSIYGESLRMDQLIDTLLEFSLAKDYAITRKTVNLSEIAKVIIENLKMTQPERVVTFIVAEELTAEVDDRLMRIFLDNLLGNAWKYTSRKNEAIIEFGATVVDGRKTYLIKDNGVGFHQNDANKLFDPFLRLRSEYDGLGIGLATAKRIIDRHGGTIWAEGEEDAGATFFFSL